MALVEDLEAAQREAVLLIYAEGLSIEEIAQRTQTPVSALRARLSCSLDRLRAQLDAKYLGDREAWMNDVGPLARG